MVRGFECVFVVLSAFFYRGRSIAIVKGRLKLLRGPLVGSRDIPQKAYSKRVID